MKVILTENIDKIGKAGDVVSVKDGYARNFLFPRNMAKEATAGNMKVLEVRNKKMAIEDARKLEALRALANRIGNLSLTINMQVGDEEKLFGSVTADIVAEKLLAESIEIDKRNIIIDEPIKKLGVYTITIKLHPEVKALLRLWVVKK